MSPLHSKLSEPNADVRGILKSELPIGSSVVPFWGLYFGFYKVNPKKKLLWSLWVTRQNRTIMECPAR